MHRFDPLMLLWTLIVLGATTWTAAIAYALGVPLPF